MLRADGIMKGYLFMGNMLRWLWLAVSTLGFFTFIASGADAPPSLSCTPAFRADLGATGLLAGSCTLSARDSGYTYTAAGSEAWLRVVTANGSVAAGVAGRVDFTVNPVGLAPGTYVGFVNVRASVAPDPPAAMIILTISSTPPRPTLTVNRTEIAFQGTIGEPGPTQELTVSGSQALMPLAMTVKTARGGDWLYASLSANGAPARLLLATAGDRLAPGRYDGTVTVSSPGSTAPPVEVRVSLTVDKTITMLYHLEDPLPTPRCFAVPTDVAPQALTVTDTQGAWLAVTPDSERGQNAFCVGLQTEGLRAGDYTGGFALTPGELRVDVKLRVTPPAKLTAAPTSLSFLAVPGRATPPQATRINLENGDPALPVRVTVSEAAREWLRVAGESGGAPVDLVISVETAKLTPGIYTGVVRVAAVRENGPVVDVPVTLDVPAVSIRVNPATISLTYEVGTEIPAGPKFSIVATDPNGRSFNVPLRTSTAGDGGSGSGPAWLTAPGPALTAPVAVALGFNPAGLARGTYAASVVVEAPGTVNGRVVVPVGLAVVSPRLVTEQKSIGLNVREKTGTAAVRTLQVKSSAEKTPMAFNVEVRQEAGRSWLTLQGVAARTTPAAVAVTIRPGDLGPGVYRGSIVLTANESSNRVVTVPVVLVVRKTAALQVAPGAVEFSYQIDYLPPDPKVVRVSGEGTDFRTSVPGGASWMGVTETDGTTPTTIHVTVDPTGLEPGQYTSVVRLEPLAEGVAPQVIPVSLTVTNAPRPVISPKAFEFETRQGSTAPINGMIEMHSNGDLLRVRAAALVPGGNWLTASGLYTAGAIDTGTSMVVDNPVNIPFRIDASGLTAGTYRAAVELIPENQEERVVVPVTLTVRPANPMLPLLRDGNGVRTAISMVSLDREEAAYTVRFYQQNGQPMVVPLVNGGRVQEISGKIPAGGTATIETTGSDPATLQGWAEIVSARRIAGYAAIAGQPAVIPLRFPQGKSALAAFDSSNGATSVTVVNPGPAETTVTVRARSEEGRELGTETLRLGAMASTEFSVAGRFPGTDGNRGTVELVSSGGEIGVSVTKRSADGGAGLPAASLGRGENGEARDRLIPHFVDVDGLRSVMVLMNTGGAAAPFSLTFRDNDGYPIEFPIAGGGLLSEYGDTIAPGAVRFVETEGLAEELLEGTVELTSPATVTGAVVYLPAGGGASDVEAPTGRGLLLPFDETQGNVLYLAISNPGVMTTNNTYLVARGEDGGSLGRADIPLGVFGRQYVRASELFPALSGKRGVIEVFGPEVSMAGVLELADGTTLFVPPTR